MLGLFSCIHVRPKGKGRVAMLEAILERGWWASLGQSTLPCFAPRSSSLGQMGLSLPRRSIIRLLLFSSLFFVILPSFFSRLDGPCSDLLLMRAHIACFATGRTTLYSTPTTGHHRTWRHLSSSSSPSLLVILAPGARDSRQNAARLFPTPRPLFPLACAAPCV